MNKNAFGLADLPDTTLISRFTWLPRLPVLAWQLLQGQVIWWLLVAVVIVVATPGTVLKNERGVRNQLCAGSNLDLVASTRGRRWGWHFAQATRQFDAG
jgi:hypothetical protein